MLLQAKNIQLFIYCLLYVCMYNSSKAFWVLYYIFPLDWTIWVPGLYSLDWTIWVPGVYSLDWTMFVPGVYSLDWTIWVPNINSLD